MEHSKDYSGSSAANCDVFYDIACGKGHVYACSLDCHCEAWSGIELDPLLPRHDGTILRAFEGSKLNQSSTVKMLRPPNTPAGTIYFSYWRFGPEMMRASMSIERSVKVDPRKITIVYYNATLDYILRDAPWLEHICDLSDVNRLSDLFTKRLSF